MGFGLKSIHEIPMVMECESHCRDSIAWRGIIKSLNNVKGGFGWNVGAGDGQMVCPLGLILSWIKILLICKLM